MRAGLTRSSQDHHLAPDGFSMTSSDGLLRVRGVGFFTTEGAGSHFDELSRQLAAVRSRGTVKVLVDLREAVVQSQEVAAFISSRTASIYGPSDRVAILVGTMLQKVQMQRTHADKGFGVFIDEADALAFLDTNAAVD